MVVVVTQQKHESCTLRFALLLKRRRCSSPLLSNFLWSDNFHVCIIVHVCTIVPGNRAIWHQYVPPTSKQKVWLRAQQYELACVLEALSLLLLLLLLMLLCPCTPYSGDRCLGVAPVPTLLQQGPMSGPLMLMDWEIISTDKM